MDVQQLQMHVIRPTLQFIELHSPEAEQLILGTAAQESRFQYLVQVGQGPALGICQMEPATHNDIWKNYLAYPRQFKLAQSLRALVPPRYREAPAQPPYPDALVGCLEYAIAMARTLYRRLPEALPAFNDINAQAAYYKKHYNTAGGAATLQQYIDNYNRLVKPVASFD